MYLYFNFLITWVNNYGIIARQVWLHFENWSPTGWICYVWIAVMCARIRPWGSPFSAILCGVVVSAKSLVYFLQGADDLLHPVSAVIRVSPLRAMVFICFHVFPPHHLWAPGGPEHRIYVLSTAMTFELDTLLVRGYTQPPDFYPPALCGQHRDNTWLWMSLGGYDVCSLCFLVCGQPRIYFTCLTPVGILACVPSVC